MTGSKGGGAVETAIGHVPTPESLNLNGLKGVSPETMSKLLAVDNSIWREEVKRHLAWLEETFKGDCPPALRDQGKRLLKRLG